MPGRAVVSGVRSSEMPGPQGTSEEGLTRGIRFHRWRARREEAMRRSMSTLLASAIVAMLVWGIATIARGESTGDAPANSPTLEDPTVEKVPCDQFDLDATNCFVTEGIHPGSPEAPLMKAVCAELLEQDQVVAACEQSVLDEVATHDAADSDDLTPEDVDVEEEGG